MNQFNNAVTDVFRKHLDIVFFKTPFLTQTYTLTVLNRIEMRKKN